MTLFDSTDAYRHCEVLHGIEHYGTRFVKGLKPPTEHQEQVRLFNWWKLIMRKSPLLPCLFAIPNGGYRHAHTGFQMQREGVLRGIPDICLAVPTLAYHGLYIELKRRSRTSKLSDDQRNVMAALNAQGYLAVCCLGADAAQYVIERYLGRAGETSLVC